MKILFISYDFPYPPTGGSICRDYNLIKQLSKHNELYWINRTIRGEIKQEYIDEMKQYFKDMRIVPWDYNQSLTGFLKSLVSKKPYIINRFESLEMKNIVREMTEQNNFDLIFCDHVYLVQYIPEELFGKIPIIPNNEDCGFTYYKRMTMNSGYIRKIYAHSQWKKILDYEIDVLKKFNAYITTSEKEKESISGYYDKANICVIDNGVDTKYFYERERTDFNPNIVFTAWFKYYPNAEAAIHFVKKIFPLIKNEIPDFKFYIVGKEPPPSVKNLERTEGVVVTGYVDDVREYLANADAAVVPLQIGGGTRLKILEAMSMKVPVISTELGAEGLVVEDGKDIFIARDNIDFAKKIITIIKDKSVAVRLAENGRKLVEKKYNWEIIGNKLNNFITDFVKHY